MEYIICHGDHYNWIVSSYVNNNNSAYVQFLKSIPIYMNNKYHHFLTKQTFP